MPRARRPRDVSGHGHRAGHRRPGHQGDPGRPGRHRRELPDERPLRRRLRALPRLHRRRDEHGPARAGPDGDEVDQDHPHQLDLHRVRRRRAARPAQPGRQARGHHGRPAPRHHPARHVDPGALGRHPRPVHLHRRRRQERGRGEGAEGPGERELRRAAAQHRPGFDLHRRARRRHVRLARGGRRRQGSGSRKPRGNEHDPHHRHRHRLRRRQEHPVPGGERQVRMAGQALRAHPPARPHDAGAGRARRRARGGQAVRRTTSTTSPPPAKARTSSSRPATSIR